MGATGQPAAYFALGAEHGLLLQKGQHLTEQHLWIKHYTCFTFSGLFTMHLNQLCP